MHSFHIETAHGIFHGLRFGHGPKLMIALHGHGESARTVLPLTSLLGTNYTVFALDLPFHGKTVWRKDHFTPLELKSALESILFQEQKEQFSLLGFSFGGRAVLALTEHFQKHLESVFLLAPDGISTPSLTKFFIVPTAMQNFLEKRVQNPDWLLRPTRFLYKIGFLPKQKMDFLENNLTRPHRIQRAFGMWRSLSHFAIAPNQAALNFNEMAIPVHVFSAFDDPHIPISALRHFVKNIPSARLFEFRGGHHIIGTRELELALGSVV